jgi:hypothetical protein
VSVPNASSVIIIPVAYLLKARILVPEKRTLLGNGGVKPNNGVTVGSGVLYAACAEAI